MPRATFFDDASHALSTRTEYERLGQPYCVAAHKAGQDDVTPDVAWLAEYFAQLRATRGKSWALRHARAIGHHMRVHGGENLCDHREIEVVLYAPDPLDPLFREVSQDVGNARVRKRAQYFMNSAYCSGTTAAYYREILKWAESLCLSDPKELERSREDDVFGYLQQLATRYSGHHVRNARNAISHFFRSRNLTDVARTARIDAFVRSVKGQGPQRTDSAAQAFTSDERRRLVAVFEGGPSDIRDRTLMIICAFSRYTAETVVAITVDRCHEELDGYRIESEDPRRFPDTFVGGSDDPEFDIRIWLPRLIALVSEGPLFRSMGHRGEFGDRAGSATMARHAFVRAGELAGLGADVLGRLKRTFRRTVIAARGPTVLKRQLSIKKLHTTELRISELGRTVRLEARRRRPKYRLLSSEESGYARRQP